MCDVSSVCYYCRIALARQQEFKVTDIGIKCLMALDDPHEGFATFLNPFDYYLLSSYSIGKIQDYGDTEELGKEELEKLFLASIVKLNTLLSLNCNEV